MRSIELTEEQQEIMECQSRVMILMFEATGDEKYLDRSVKCIKEVEGDFLRPLGVIREVA